LEALTIAVDAMGGDHGVKVVVPAAVRSLSKHPQLHLMLVGNESSLERA